MGRGDRDEDDLLSRRDAPDAVDRRHADQRPARLGLARRRAPSPLPPCPDNARVRAPRAGRPRPGNSRRSSPPRRRRCARARARRPPLRRRNPLSGPGSSPSALAARHRRKEGDLLARPRSSPRDARGPGRARRGSSRAFRTRAHSLRPGRDSQAIRSPTVATLDGGSSSSSALPTRSRTQAK